MIIYVVMDVIAFPENLETTCGLSILLPGVISHPDATSYDNNKYLSLAFFVLSENDKVKTDVEFSKSRIYNGSTQWD